MNDLNLRIAGVIDESIVDGPGIRFVIFTQGCPHHCPGCHNPQTHDFSGGELVPISRILSDIQADPLISGVTLSGGEPFCQPEPLAAAPGAAGLLPLLPAGQTFLRGALLILIFHGMTPAP